MDLSKINLPRVDSKTSDKGVWCDITPSCSCLIGRYGNTGHKEAIKRLVKHNKTFIDKGTMDNDLAERMLGDIMAEHILLDWKGMLNGDKELPYDKETAKLVLADPELYEFREWVEAQSKNIENFRLEKIKK